jgi:putative addiction module component (TIGR02574 family)
MTHVPLPPEIRDLPVGDRVRLVDQIWDSVVQDESDFTLTKAQRDELRKRLAAHDANPTSGTPWDEVKTRLLGE